MRRSFFVAGLLISLALVLTSIILLQQRPPDSHPSPSAPNVTEIYRLTPAFPGTSFRSPIGIGSANDASGSLYVVEQGGVVKLLSRLGEGNPRVSAFLDISSKVISGGELGLLGLAFHPNFHENGFLYVDYTAPDPLRTVIARYTMKAGANQADDGSELIIMEFSQPYANHNGGQLAFGPDGYLYIATGDGGSAGDPRGNAQNRSSLLSKILRIDVDKSSEGRSYSIPGDNPFAGNAFEFREEIYAYGLRNPWRFSFDAATGRLWAGDVGQNRIEEVNVVQKGGNYGWNVMEGSLCYSSPNCDKSGFTPPVWEYDHSLGISIIGGFVYRGPTLDRLHGLYIFGDYGSGRIWALSYNGSEAQEIKELVHSSKNITSFGVDDEGELYICATDGQVYRLTLG